LSYATKNLLLVCLRKLKYKFKLKLKSTIQQSSNTTIPSSFCVIFVYQKYLVTVQKLERDTVQILRSNGLSKTEVRKKVLELFLESEVALSLQDIESAFGKLDRITLYRTLKTFEGKGIIHKAIDGTNHPKYAMCVSDCSEHHHEDNHAHFHCLQCEKTICLDHVPTPNIPNIPENYSVEETNLILSGICADCA
jgi:Fur family ferric uptake transcriptional regulator